MRFPAFAKTMEVQLVFHRYPVAKADANVNQNELLDKSHHVNLRDFRTVDVVRLDEVSFQYISLHYDFAQRDGIQSTVC